jgi:regulator of protease activity HflC (stomatin/prohibitin superfamily)
MSETKKETKSNQTKTLNSKNKNIMKSLPENLKMLNDDGEVLANPFSGAIKSLITRAKVKDYNNKETGVTKTANEIVKDLFLMHFQATDENPAELPDGMEAYEKVSAQIAEIVADHKKAEEAEKEKAKNAKEAKQQQRLAEKEAKEAAEKEMLRAQEAFELSLTRRFPDTEDYGPKLVAAALKGIKLPENVTFSGNQMGIVFGEGVTKEQLGETAATLIGAMEGKVALEGALQFTMGDLVNQSVKSKLYRTKNDAQQGIKFIVEEKMKRKYNGGTLNYYALMAERIPVEKRKLGVTPSLYLTASKAVLPRLADSDAKVNDANAAEFEQLRNKLVDEINEGNLSNIKEVQAKIAEFKAGKGIVKESPAEKNAKVAKMLKQFFFASWIREYLVDPEAESATVKMKEKGAYGKLTTSALTDMIEEAKNELQNLLIPEADTVIAGEKVIAEGTKDQETVKVFLDYPFEELTADLKEQAEARKAEAEKKAKEAEEEKAKKAEEKAAAAKK